MYRVEFTLPSCVSPVLFSVLVLNEIHRRSCDFDKCIVFRHRVDTRHSRSMLINKDNPAFKDSSDYVLMYKRSGRIFRNIVVVYVYNIIRTLDLLTFSIRQCEV